MESILKYDEESINSCEDHHSDKVDLGVGRSYECVFCKRGFNTAQALGGHMNIHRKDRARNKPNNSINHHHHHHVYTGPRLMIPSAHHDHRFSSRDHPAASSTSTTRPYHQQQQPLDIPGNWRKRLSLEFPPLMIREDLEKEKDLDLELRLGYH